MLSTQKHSTGLIGLPVTKTCTKCGELLPISHFYKHPETKDGHQSNCKKCIKSSSQGWTLNNRFAATCSQAKRRAKKKDLKFNLTADYLESIDRDQCPYLEIPIEFSKLNNGRGYALINGKSLDRITPELGYVKGNVVWCSEIANRLLSSYTAEQLLEIPLLHQVGLNFMRLLTSTKPTEYETTEAAS